MHHMTANWSPIAQEERNQLCFGVWGTVGTDAVGGRRWSTCGRRPGSPGSPTSFDHESGDPSLQDPAAREVVGRGRRASAVVESTASSCPAPWSPTIGELNAAGVRGAVYAHELITVERGTGACTSSNSFASMRSRHWRDHGVTLVGAFRTALRDDDECIVMWAIPTWEAWATYETAIEAGEWSPGSNVAGPQRRPTSGS